MIFQYMQTSLPECLVELIYSYIPNHELYSLSTTNFNLHIEDYYKKHKKTKEDDFIMAK